MTRSVQSTDDLRPGEFLQVVENMGHYVLYWIESGVVQELRWCSGWPSTTEEIQAVLSKANEAFEEGRLYKVTRQEELESDL